MWQVDTNKTRYEKYYLFDKERTQNSTTQVFGKIQYKSLWSVLDPFVWLNTKGKIQNDS